jgi:hypothetical protein
MKKSIIKTAITFGLFLFILSLSTSKTQAYPNRGVTLQTFYDELSYYGDWIDNPDYGYVWRPNVTSDFRPYYTNGRWAMTEYGNTWVSDYEWGWAPFHYGRWFYDDDDGWVWLPDTVWGPSWVSWRSGGGYYGWAPLGPRISINYNFYRNYYVPNNHWVFIPQRCIYYPSYARYWEPRRNVFIINNTNYINNIYSNNRNVRCFTGPRADEIRTATRQNVPIYRISDDNKPGLTRIDRGNVRIYRPEIKGDGRNAAPKSIANNTGRPSRDDTDGITRGGVSHPSTGNGRPQRPDAITNPRSTDNATTNRSGVSNPSTGSGRPQRPDPISNPRSSDNYGNNRGSMDNPSSRSDGNLSSNDRPVRSSSPSVDRGNTPVRQEPAGGDSDNRTIQRPDAPRVDRPNPSPRQEPENGTSSRPERSQPAQPAPRQETRTESAPRLETRTESRPQRSEPVSAPRQETPRTEPQRESGSSRTESSRPSVRSSIRGN